MVFCEINYSIHNYLICRYRISIAIHFGVTSKKIIQEGNFCLGKKLWDVIYLLDHDLRHHFIMICMNTGIGQKIQLKWHNFLQLFDVILLSVKSKLSLANWHLYFLSLNLSSDWCTEPCKVQVILFIKLLSQYTLCYLNQTIVFVLGTFVGKSPSSSEFNMILLLT